MKKDPAKKVRVDAWMPLWIGDYLADTARLTTEQHGAYLLLLMAYWRNKGPLVDDDEELATITALGAAGWGKQRPKLARLFKVADGFWRHPRTDAELANAMGLAEKRRAKAIAAAEARWAREQDAPGNPPSNAPSNAPSIDPTPETDAQSIAGAVLEECPSPSPSPSTTSSIASVGSFEGYDVGRRALDSGALAEQFVISDRQADAVAVIKGLRQRGLAASNVWDERLHKALEAGHTPDAILALADELIEARPNRQLTLAYLLATARGRKADAATEPTHGTPATPARTSAAETVLRNIERRHGRPTGDPVGD